MASTYVIDTSSLIELPQHYPSSNFSGLWDHLEGLVANVRLIAPTEVFKEISPGKSHELFQWCKKNKEMFVDMNSQMLQFVSDIMTNHKGLVPLDKSGPVADPFVIALARSRMNNLTDDKIFVVTQEGVGSINKIPFVCRSYNLTAIKLMELIRLENWKF